MRHANPKGTKDVKVLKMGCEYECDPDVMEVEDLIHEDERRREGRKAKRRTRLPVTYSAGMGDVKPEPKRRKLAQQVADDQVEGPAQGSRQANGSESEAPANGDDDVTADTEPVPPLFAKPVGRDELVSGTTQAAKTISDDDASSLDREAPAGDRHVAVTGCGDALYKGDASVGQDDGDDDVAHSKSAAGCDEDVCESSASYDDGSVVDLGEREDNANGDASDDDDGEVDRGECQGNASDVHDEDATDGESPGAGAADRRCQDDVHSARDDDGDDVDLETDELSMSGQPEVDGVAKGAGDGADRVGGRGDASQSSSESDIDIDRSVSAAHQVGAIDREDGPPDEDGIESDDDDHVQEGRRAADPNDDADDRDTNARDRTCEASDAGRAWSRLKAALGGHSLSPEDPIRLAPSTDTSSKVDKVDPAGDAPLSKSDRRRLREERRKRKEERARLREERRRGRS